jgi:hypothetical protein
MPTNLALANATVLGPDGSPTQVGSLWADGTVVLVFLRHFG